MSTNGANGERLPMVVEIRAEADRARFFGRTVYRAYNILGISLHASGFRVEALKRRLRDLHQNRDIAFLGPVHLSSGKDFYRERMLAQIAVEISRTMGLSGTRVQQLHELLGHYLLPSHCPFCVALHSEHATKASTNPEALVRREEGGSDA